MLLISEQATNMKYRSLNIKALNKAVIRSITDITNNFEKFKNVDAVKAAEIETVKMLEHYKKEANVDSIDQDVDLSKVKIIKENE